MPCASFSMLDGPGGTGCDVPVHGNWDSRGVIVAAVSDCVRECMGLVMYQIQSNKTATITPAIQTTMNPNIAASSTATVKHWKWCTWHRKASAKNSSKLNKFLHSEVNLLIQHIIVRDQDGHNNMFLNLFQDFKLNFRVDHSRLWRGKGNFPLDVNRLRDHGH